MERERLGSRLGFILLSAGCAIGCGNVWKFPWTVGKNGGGGFLLIYLICLLVLGLRPVLLLRPVRLGLGQLPCGGQRGHGTQG
jgi:Na+-dependent transporters of the SNF family